MLPRARIIHCRRDPLDTCLSCYFQDFGRGLGFTYDLPSLGRTYRGYERLMAHWQAVLPLQIHAVEYERLVDSIDTELARLLGFLGLPWDEACLAFHHHERPVHTASFFQVRQPLYQDSVGRWRRYEKHLAPLIEALTQGLH